VVHDDDDDEGGCYRAAEMPRQAASTLGKHLPYAYTNAQIYVPVCPSLAMVCVDPAVVEGLSSASPGVEGARNSRGGWSMSKTCPIAHVRGNISVNTIIEWMGIVLEAGKGGQFGNTRQDVVGWSSTRAPHHHAPSRKRSPLLECTTLCVIHGLSSAPL